MQKYMISDRNMHLIASMIIVQLIQWMFSMMMETVGKHITVTKSVLLCICWFWYVDFIYWWLYQLLPKCFLISLNNVHEPYDTLLCLAMYTYFYRSLIIDYSLTVSAFIIRVIPLPLVNNNDNDYINTNMQAHRISV